MSTPIGSSDKKDLAGMIAENNSFNKWYAKFHAKKDAATTASFQKDIVALNEFAKAKKVEKDRFSEEYNALIKKQTLERRALDKKHEAAVEIVNDAHRKTDTIVDKKVDAIQTRLGAAGFKSNYRYSRNDEQESDTWILDKTRLDNEYHDWLRKLRMRMMTSLTVEDADAISKEFWLE